MSLYSYVENGVIVEGPKGLPRSWRNVSGLDKATTAELKAKGWFPTTINRDAYDPITHRLKKQPAIFTPDDVTINYTAEALSADAVVANTYRKWQEDMVASDDVMPRYVEDIYDVLPQAQRDNMSDHVKATKKKIADKKALRASEPPKPPENP